MFGDTNDETNFPYKSLLTVTQVSRICKALANGSSANIKLPKSQLSRMVQLGGFIEPFLKFKDTIAELGPGVSANSARDKLSEEVPKLLLDVGRNFTKKQFLSEGSGIMLTNNEIKNIIKLTRSLENRGIL